MVFGKERSCLATAQLDRETATLAHTSVRGAFGTARMIWRGDSAIWQGLICPPQPLLLILVNDQLLWLVFQLPSPDVLLERGREK